MSLNLNLALIIEKCPISGYFWNPGIKIQKLPEIIQNHDIFQSLRPNSSSVTKIKWNLCLIYPNWQKIGHLKAISRVPENSCKFPGMMKFWNSVLKIKFLDINWLGFTPYILISVKTSQFQGTSGILESWIPGSRNHNISQNVRKINTNMLRRLVF